MHQQQPHGQYGHSSNEYGNNAPPGYGSYGEYGGGYGGYPQQQMQPGIPMQYGATAPAAGAVQCNMTRAELEAKLQASNYGANSKIYECYFRRRDQNSATQQAPLCLACGLPIQSHSGGGASVPMQGTTTAAIENHGDPSNLQRGITEDVAQSGYLWGLLLGAGICLVTGCILFIAFGASGLIAKSAVVIIGPCICTTIGFAMLFMTKKSKITFDRANKTVRFEESRICCKVTDASIPFSDLTGKATMEPTAVRVNGVPQVEIVAGLVPGSRFHGQLILQRGGMFSLMSAAQEWTGYLTRLKQSSGY